MTYLPGKLDTLSSRSLASFAGPADPRLDMHERLPEVVQPFLTWLTAKPRPGEQIRERSPMFFVSVALLQTGFGIALSAFGLMQPVALAVVLVAVGMILTTSGLGLFQVVVFHHCSHGTVFKSRQTNIWIGRAISSLLLFKHFDVYKQEHMMHHSHKKLLTEEDEFASFVFGMCGLKAGVSKRDLWRRVLINLISPLFHGRFLVRRVRAAWRSDDHLHNLGGAAIWALAAGLTIATGHIAMLFWAWIVPVTVLLQAATVFRILCEHRFPEPELIMSRTKDFACHATAGVFPGVLPPAADAPALARLAGWIGWWANMLTVQLLVRVIVLVGDAPCHDYHHRRPASRRWTSYIQARQLDAEAGSPGFQRTYQETWGLFRAVDENLASLSVTPKGLFHH